MIHTPASSSWVLRARTVFSVCAVLGVGLLAVGCGQQAGETPVEEKPTLTVWYSNFREDTMKRLVDDKQTENSTLISRRFDADKLEPLAVDNIAADTSPDVWILPNDWIPDHINKFITIPDDFWNETELGGHATTTANITQKYIPAIATDLIGEDGRVAGFPGPAQTLVLYKNRTLFSETYNEWLQNNPDASQEEVFNIQRILTQDIVTWDDFVAASNMITRRGPGGDVTRAGAAIGTAANVAFANDIVQLMMYQQGGKVVDSVKRIALFNIFEKRADGQTYFPGKDALTFYTSFADSSNKNYSWNASFSNSRQSFMDGKVAMVIDYPELEDVIIQNKTSISYEKKAVPQLYKDRDQANFARYYVAAVTKASQNQRLAAALAKVVMIDGGSSLIGGWSGSSTPLLDNSTSSSDINLKQLQTAKTVYKRHHILFDQAFSEMIDDVAVRKLTIDNAINRGAERITNILQSE